MERTYIHRIGRGLFVLVILLLLAAALVYVTPLIYPFLISWALAYIINPIVNFLYNTAKIPRWLAVSSALLLFAAAMLTIISALITRIIVEIVHLSKSLNVMIGFWKTQFEQFVASSEIQSLIDRLNTFYQQNPNYQHTINSRISDAANLLANKSSEFISFFLNGLINVIISLPNWATLLIIVLLAAFFIGKDWNTHLSQISGWLPESVRRSLSAVWHDLQKALVGYCRAQLIMISITTVVVTIGLLILQVEYAITIGLLIGLVDLLPYLGVGAAMIPWIAYLFLYGDPSLAIGLSILYGVILIARQILEPKVLASSVGLQPLPTLIAMFAGLQLFGIFGLIAGPVTLVILSAIHRAHVFHDIYSYIMYGNK
ncbi:sporulation integral membrane protein YtvI [Paenibacillus sp. GCM10027626]|uniref:sporulation integral membrane protein YtvI n=1 Tax=Paenibacillus sp. GCM10027626 TaxID=3273411 RepID=UPI0036385BA9